MPVVGGTAFASAGEALSLARSLLNDADIPSNLTIVVNGVVRAGNVVTITTTVAHGLQVGSIVQIASVNPSALNGTYTVASVPTPTSFTFPFSLGSPPNGTYGIGGVVSILIQGDWAQDAVLLPLLNKAYRKVQRRLQQAGSRTTTNDVVLLNMPIGTLYLSDSSNPQLPVDFIAPREVFERISGQPYFNPPMRSVDALPNCPQSTYNGCYAWFEDSLNFIGATSELDVRLRYFAGFPWLSDATSSIQIRGGVDAVASYTAYLASNARAPEAAGTFGQQFEDDIKELLNIQSHARQYKPARRRPNNSTRGYCGGWYGTV